MQLRNLICGLTLALTCSPLGLLAQTPTAKEGAQLLGAPAPIATGSNPDSSLVPAAQGTDAAVTVLGTVSDVDGGTVPGATVTFEGPSPSDNRTVVTSDSGFFKLDSLTPGIPYHVAVTASGFANWSSPDVILLKPGQVLDMTDVNLQVAT